MDLTRCFEPSTLLEKIVVVFCYDLNFIVFENLGGYDQRLAENREYLEELKTLATEEGVDEQVIFVPSCSTSQRNALLAACICVLYTPMVYVLFLILVPMNFS